MSTIIRKPFHLRRYDIDDLDDLNRLRRDSVYLPGLEGAWPVRGRRARDKNPPPPPSNGRRANGPRPS
jgi:hypothetical protein